MLTRKQSNCRLVISQHKDHVCHGLCTYSYCYFLLHDEPRDMLATLAAQGVTSVNDPIQLLPMMNTLINPQNLQNRPMMETRGSSVEAFELNASSDLTLHLDTQQLGGSHLAGLIHPSTGYEPEFLPGKSG